MSYALFLDDDANRIPCKLPWIELPPYNWVIVRSYDEFVKTITERDLPFVVSFDHDLGDTAYQEFHRAHNADKIIKYENIAEKTGFHCAQFLANYCIEHKLKLPLYYIHTLNSIGAMNIFSILENARIMLTESHG